jgi:hypothetical protein
MAQIALDNEAESCRQMAREFAGRPEEPFLLRLASAMEELALIQKRSSNPPGPGTAAA